MCPHCPPLHLFLSRKGPESGALAHTCHPALRSLGQQDQELKDILGHMWSARLLGTLSQRTVKQCLPEPQADVLGIQLMILCLWLRISYMSTVFTSFPPLPLFPCSPLPLTCMALIVVAKHMQRHIHDLLSPCSVAYTYVCLVLTTWDWKAPVHIPA